jgi:aspartate/methionine/tyrosine aminotransferase
MSRLTPLAKATAAIPHSGIRELADAAVNVPGAIRLDVGQPDFATPPHVVDAAKRALDEGWTSYTQTQGLRSLRELIVPKIARVNGYRVDPDQLACGPGGVSVIAAAFGAVLEPGDEVLVPDPAWPNYALMAAWTHTRVVRYPCPAELGFLPDVERLEELITPRTKLLVVNSPNNPTGAVYPLETVRALAGLAERHNVWLLSDECYDEIVHEGRSLSPAALVGDSRVISAYSFSKTYAMTGWRLGYVTGAHRLVDSVTKVLESQCSCAPSVSQKAAEAALSGPQDCVEQMRAAYRRRRDQVVARLREARLLTSVPHGAFYIMADVSPSRLSGRDFAFRLLRDCSVSVAPGSAFGEVATRAVRISLASSEEDLAEGVDRLCHLVSELAHGETLKPS